MTNQQNHLITPSPELVQQWDKECDSGYNPEIDNTFDALKCFASKAAQWGADQELEACCEFLDDNELCDPNFHKDLRAARRPKPPSLKEQALAALAAADGADHPVVATVITADQHDTIRRALEQLDD